MTVPHVRFDIACACQQPVMNMHARSQSSIGMAEASHECARQKQVTHTRVSRMSWMTLHVHANNQS